MKKVYVTLLIVALCFSLGACDGTSPENQNQINESTANTVEETAKDTGEPTYSGREMYEKCISSFIIIDDELSRGWFDHDAQEFVKFIKGNHVSTDALITDLIKVYRGLDNNIEHTNYSIRDFFTVTESNEPTSMGLYNFFQAVNQLESKKFNNADVIKTNENGNVTGFDFDIVGGDKSIADALGVSEDFVNMMIHTASDSGFNVTFD